MNPLQQLESQRIKIRHWLHIVLVLLTGGFWLVGYAIRAAMVKAKNDKLDVKLDGAREAYAHQYFAQQNAKNRG